MKGDMSPRGHAELLKKFLLIFIIIAVSIISEYIDKAILSKNTPAGPDIFPPWISSVDASLFLSINVGLANLFFAAFFQLSTHLGSTFAVMMLCVVLYLLDFKREAFLIFTSIVIGTALTLPIKVLVPRPRPYVTLPVAMPLEMEAGSSFPSGHSERMFALTVVLSKKKSRLTLPLYSLALLIAFSRVYIGVHYPLDIAFGSLLGWVNGKMVLRYEDRLESTLKKLDIALF